MFYIWHYVSPLGDMTMAEREGALAGLWFEGQKYFESSLKGEVREEETALLKETSDWLDLYFSGCKPLFTPRLSPSGTRFQRAVWRALLTIPYGETRTYGEMAEAALCFYDMGDPFEDINTQIYEDMKAGSESFSEGERTITPSYAETRSCFQKAGPPDFMEDPGDGDFLKKTMEADSGPSGKITEADPGSETEKNKIDICKERPEQGKDKEKNACGKKSAKEAGTGKNMARAAGQAIGRNPISIIIPCHRVIGKNKSLTGYAGGLERKKRLLELEGAKIC